MAITQTHLEDSEVFFGKLAEVDTLVRFEVKRKLATIPLVLGVDDLHGEATLDDLFAADHHCVVLFLELFHHTADC